MANQKSKKPVVSKTVGTVDETGQKLTIKRILPDNTPTLFCDGIMVQHSPEAFFLSFLQTRHELLTNEERARLKEVEVNQICVTRIVITPVQMAQNLKALTANFSKWLGKTNLKAKNFEEALKELGVEEED